MGTKFRALLALQLRCMLSSLRMGSRRRAASGVGAALLMAGLACYLSCLYSFTFAGQLAQVGMLPLLIALMGVLAAAMGVFFTLFAAQGVVFGGKDNDLMLSLPVSPFALLLSRALALYLENLLVSLFVLLPAGAAYQFHGGGGGAAFWLALVPGAVVLALLPTLIALVCGFVLAWLTSRFVRRALLSTLCYGAFLVLLMAGVFRLNGLMTSLAQSAAGLQSGLAGWGLPFLLLEEAACLGRPQDLLALAGLCLLPFLGAVWLFARRYQAILARLAVRAGRSDYRLKALASGSPCRALLAKEARRFFSTPIYLFNSGFGLFLLVGGGVAALVFRARLAPTLDLLVQAGVPALPLAAAALAFVISTVAITASSISLEGRCLWILQTAPVSAAAVLLVKTAFQLLLVLPCLALCVACLTPALALGAAGGGVLFAVTGAFALCCAPLGLWCNLLFPRLDAPNDTVVVKQSLAALLGTFLPMALAALAGGLYLLLAPRLGCPGALLACALLFLLTAAPLFALLLSRPRLFLERKSRQKELS